MKIKTYIILSIIILTSCHLLQKDKLTLKKLKQKEELQLTEQRNTLSHHNQLILIDSNYTDFAAIIWPKGSFIFSLSNGFEGEAEKVIIKGKHTSQKVLNLKQETRRDSTLLKANYTNETAASTVVKKSKLSFGYSWAWLLIIPIIYILYRLYRKYGKW